MNPYQAPEADLSLRDVVDPAMWLVGSKHLYLRNEAILPPLDLVSGKPLESGHLEEIRLRTTGEMTWARSILSVGATLILVLSLFSWGGSASWWDNSRMFVFGFALTTLVFLELIKARRGRTIRITWFRPERPRRRAIVSIAMLTAGILLIPLVALLGNGFFWRSGL